jgi:hypothetical protein
MLIRKLQFAIGGFAFIRRLISHHNAGGNSSGRKRKANAKPYGQK